jgi:hypothetical protein
VTFVDVQFKVAAPPVATVVGVAVSESVGAGGSDGGWLTVTATVWLAVLPLPRHSSAKVALVLSGPVDCVPETGFVPLHAPDARQAEAFSAAQVSVAADPFCTTPGAAVNVNVAAGATATVADFDAVPPGPVQAREYVVPLMSGPVASLPAVGRVPVQPPDAAQLVAFADDHVSVAAAAGLTVPGLTASSTVGAAGGGTTGAVVPPPPPPQ